MRFPPLSVKPMASITNLTGVTPLICGARQYFAVKSSILCGDNIGAKPLYVLETLGNKMVAIVAVVDDPQDSSPDGRKVKRVHQASRRTGNFRHGTNVTRHHGAAGGVAFDNRHPEALVGGGKNHHVAITIALQVFLIRQIPLLGVGNGVVLQRLALAVRQPANDVQPARNSPDRLGNATEVLVPLACTDLQKNGPLHMERLWGGRETIRDRIMNYPHHFGSA